MKRRFSLKRNKEFRYVYRNGKSVACRNLVLIYKKNNTGLLRVGFSVSKKIGNSVKRNLIKRRLRSAFDRYIPDINPDYNLIVIARQPILLSKFDEICSSVGYTLNKAGLLCLKGTSDKSDEKATS